MRALFLSLMLAAAPGLASADSISTFKSLCLAHIGNSPAIKAAAERAGFEFIEMGPNSFMGSRRASDETLQLNVATRHAFECAVTTSDMANPAQVSARFFAALGLPATGGSARGAVNGNTYTFLHDTNGGEAFVVYAD